MADEGFRIFGENEEVQYSSEFSDHDAPDGLLDAAFAAAQKVLDEAKIGLFVSSLFVERPNDTMKTLCQCGSRCVEYTSQPYQRCWIENGQQICVTGYRQVCTRHACNPC